MKRIENIDYRQNEWIVLYVDYDSETQTVVLNTYEEAERHTKQLRNAGVPVIGILTSRFYNAKLADE